MKILNKDEYKNLLNEVGLIAKFFIGDISYELSKGDSVYFDSGIPHAEVAMGDREAQFIAVVMK